MEPRQVEYVVTGEDFAAFNVHVLRTDPEQRRQVARHRVGGMVAAGVLALVLGWALLGDAVVAVVAAGVAAVGWWVTWPKAVARSVRKTALRLGRPLISPAPARTRLWLDDEGLHEECNGVVTNAEWSGVQRVDETDDHGFVFVSPMSAVIVPKREDRAGVSAFLAEARARAAGARMN